MDELDSQLKSFLRPARRLADRARHRLLPGIHFLHIGKTGGTAIRDSLTGASCPSRLWLHGHGTCLRDVPQGQQFFLCLREPVSRFVSGFNSRMRQGRPRRNVPWNGAEIEAFSYFQNANELGEALSHADRDVRKRAERAMRGIRHVQSSFFDWVASEAYFESRLPDLLWICFQESLDQDFEELTRLLRLEDGARLPVDEVGAHRTPASYSKALSMDASQNLREWYERDIAFYNLCREKRGEWCQR